MQTQEERFLSLAIEAARESVRRGDEPFGAVLVRDGAVVATGCNGIYTCGDRTAHAELTLVQEYCRSAGVTDLSAYTLYSSCEPCYMCSGALVWAKLGRLVYGASDADLGEILGGKGSAPSAEVFAISPASPRVTAGVCREECLALLRDYFRDHEKNLTHGRALARGTRSFFCRARMDFLGGTA